jgi:hypothetical protein
MRNSRSWGASTSFGRGQPAFRERSETFKFAVWADAPGEYELSPQIPSKGGPIGVVEIPTLEVVAGGAQGAMPGSPGGEAAATSTATAPEGTPAGQPFIVTELSPGEIWLGESFRYTAESYKPLQRGSRGYLVQVDKRADLPGAVKQGLGARKARREMVDGTAYKVELLEHTLVTPQRAGELVVPGPSGQAQLVEQVFFDTRALAEAVPVAGAEQRVVVKALPAAGQPSGFKPFNVGRLKISTKVDRTRVPAGEGLTLELTIFGEGNLALVEPDPWPELPATLRRYDPEVSDPQRSFKKGKARGRRVWKFLMIPDGGGKVVIPSHTLHYFDPKTGSYQVARSEEIEIVVEGEPAAAATGGSSASTSTPTGGSDQRGDADEAPLAPIRGGDELPRVASKDPSHDGLDPGTWSWMVAGVPLAFASTWLASQAWSRFGPDEAAQARLTAQKWRATTLDEATALVATGEGFWAKLSELMQRAAVERVGDEARGLTRGALAARLLDLGLPEAEVATWTELLDRGDAARFGAGGQDETARRAALERARGIVASRKWGPR